MTFIPAFAVSVFKSLSGRRGGNLNATRPNKVGGCLLTCYLVKMLYVIIKCSKTFKLQSAIITTKSLRPMMSINVTI